MQRRTRSTA